MRKKSKKKVNIHNIVAKYTKKEHSRSNDNIRKWFISWRELVPFFAAYVSTIARKRVGTHMKKLVLGFSK